MVLEVGFACGGNATGWAEELQQQAGRQGMHVITSSMHVAIWPQAQSSAMQCMTVECKSVLCNDCAEQSSAVQCAAVH